MLRIQGSIVAIVTPFHQDGSVNFSKLGELVDWQIQNGTDGIVALGTTGESATMTDEEDDAVCEYVLKRVNGRIPVIVGSGSNCTASMLEKSLRYQAMGMKETLERSNLGLLNVGDKVNVERSMMMNGRLDGHIVQGHVDQIATCISVEDAEGSYYFTFRYAFDKEMAKRGYITVDKGSVTVNGVSLTVCNPTDDTFQVAIIPYTFEYTNFHDIKVDSVVNIEFDIIGKYISRMLQFK